MRPVGSATRLEGRRIRAVSLLKEGHSCQTVARMVQSSISSLARWMQSFRRKGKAGLKPRPTPGRPPQMTPGQRQELIALLKPGAVAAGYPTELWTLPRVAEQIRQRWGVAYHPGHVWKILTGLSWSCQKPERRALQRNPRKIGQWKQRDWPRIKKARRPGAHLVFIDESGFLLIPPAQRTWAPAGHTPVLRHSYRRERLSVIGGLSVSPARHQAGLYFQIYPWNVTASEVVTGALPRLLRNLHAAHLACLRGEGRVHTMPNDRTERQPPRRDNARDFRQPERVAEASDSRTAKRGGCSLQ